MKKLVIINILCYLLMLSKILQAQITPSIVVEDIAPTNGIYNYCSYGCLISPSSPSHPVNITNTAQVTYTADCIQLLPGFSVSSLAPSASGGGSFKAQNVAPVFPVVVITPTTLPTTQVGLFEKLELGLDMPTIIDSKIHTYITSNIDPTGINPFDPDDISVIATFISPSGTKNRIIYGFYYESFDYKDDKWVDVDPAAYPYNFRVRFAPTEVGQWTCDIKVESLTGKFPTFSASCIGFSCIPSSKKGYLEVGLHKRQLKFSGTGESFFAIGQDIPWVKNPNGNTNKMDVHIFDDYYNEVKNLADNDGNFFRMVMAPWSYTIEWEKLGNYGLTDQNITGSPGVAPFFDDQNRQHNAFELDKLFDLCDQRNIFMDLSIELQDGYTYGTPGVDDFQHWDFNCYHTQIPSMIEPLNMLTDPIAKKYFKRRLRYMIARWGYSPSLAVLELLSEQDDWYHFSAPTMLDNSTIWHNEMAMYIKTGLGDKNHLLSTSFADIQPCCGLGTLGAPFGLTLLDVSSDHKYARDKDANFSRYDNMNSSSYGLLVNYDKPSIFGELGLQVPPIVTGDPAWVDPGQLEGCNDVSFHNAMWSTAFMACYGTGLNWWQEYNHSYRADNFPPIKAFFSGIDFEADDFAYAHTWKRPDYPVIDYKAETFFLRNFDKSKVMGWAHNATYWWYNVDASCMAALPGTAWHLAGPPTVAPSVEDDSYCCPSPFTDRVKITHLSIASRYNIDWYLTRNLGIPYQFSTVTGELTDIYGEMYPYFPGSYAQEDYAFKAVEHPFVHLESRTFYDLGSDTLLCGEDTIHVDGTYKNDIHDTYMYHWDFGNGQTSTLAHPTVIYSRPGTYVTTMIVTDTIGITDTLTQQIIVPNCEGRSSIIHTSESNLTQSGNEISVYPNPNNGNFTIFISEKNKKLYTVELYDFTGRKILSKENVISTIELNVVQEQKGMYLLKMISDSSVIIKKVVIQ